LRLLPGGGAAQSYFRRKNKNYIVLLIFALLVAVFYGKALWNGFVHDDLSQIVDNPDIQSLKYLYKVITSCPWEHRVYGGCNALSYYRPTMTLSYILTWQISSGAWFFHLVNLLYFLTAGFLVFLLIKFLTKNFILSFLTALIFLINPVNSEVAIWPATVPDVTFTIFVLLSTIYFIKYRQNPIFKNLLLFFLFFFLGIISKEPAVLSPIIFVFLDLFYFKTPIKEIFNFGKIGSVLKTANGSSGGEDSSDLSMKQSQKTETNIGLQSDPWFIASRIKPYLAVFASLVIYFTMRKLVLGHFGGVTNQYYGVFTIQERIFAFITLFADYVLKFIKPFPLLLFYTYEKRSDFLSLKFISSFAIFFVFFAAFIFLLIKRKNLLALAFLWFFIFLVPVLFFITSVGENIFTERYLFSPSIAFSFLLSSAFLYFWRKLRYLRILWLITLILAVGTSFYIINKRIPDFKNNDTLYSVTIRDNPKAYTIYSDYGVYLGMDKKDWEGAEKAFKNLIKVNPQWFQISNVYSNVGDIYRMRGDLDGALEYYKKSAEAGYFGYGVYNNIGAIYVEKKDYLSALINFCKAVQVSPDVQKPQENFSRILPMIDSEYENNLQGLWNDITANSSYELSKDNVIEYLGRDCQGEQCLFGFSFMGKGNETILPSLILGLSKNKVFKTEPSFDPKTSRISLELDLKYKKEIIDFIFPTCEGKYFKVKADLNNNIQ